MILFTKLLYTFLDDRRSRHQIIRLIPNKSAELVNQALKLILKQHQNCSITGDNRTELNRLTNVSSKEHICYATPYASWERGTNENHNRLVRRCYLKKLRKWLSYKLTREDFLQVNSKLRVSRETFYFFLCLFRVIGDLVR